MTSPPPARSAPPAVLVLTPPSETGLVAAILDRAGPVTLLPRPAPRDPDALARALCAADVVVGDWSDEYPLGAREAALPHSIRLVQQPGAGVDRIDVAAWQAAGVPVANAPGTNTDSVAEWCVTTAALLVRSMAWVDDEVRAGRWPQHTVLDRGCRDLGECTVGLIGAGAIGRRAAALFAAFGCTVLVASRRTDPLPGATLVDLDELVDRADVLVPTVALTPATHHLVDAGLLARLRPGSYLVNAARGAVVDEAALVAALRSGALAGAALDVFDPEPLPADSVLRTLPTVFLSAHLAGGTSTARRRISDAVAANVAAVLAGRAPSHVLPAPTSPEESP